MTPERHGPADFATTRWDVVRRAQKTDRASQWPQAVEALNELCAIYRDPIVQFCRRELRREHDAEDIAQIFLLEMANGRFFANVDEHKGKFRTLIRTCLRNLVRDLIDREKTAKRGGKIRIEPFSDEGGASTFPDEQGISADVAFDIAWATALANRALENLEERFAMRGQSSLFGSLRPYLTGKLQGNAPGEVADAIGTSIIDCHVRLHRFRKEYGKVLRREVAKTVSAPHEIESELRYLIDLLARSNWSPS